MANGAAPRDVKAAPYRLAASERRVFFGLVLGMLVASISQTIVGPAMPRIVAELGGMDHYSWVATAAMLVSAITVPIVGRLSDIFGRRGFYIGGLGIFMVGSVICGASPTFWVLIVGRAVQGIGMGTLMPLSQTIIGDIIPPRQRGKYQGVMGAVFGVTSVAGPLAGGFLTDHLGWRWLFYVPIPLGLLALFVIARFLHLDHEPRKVVIDTWGIVTLSLGLVAVLLAVSWGGVTYAWTSPIILSLSIVGIVLLVIFVLIEQRVPEPVVPLRLFRNPIFTASNIASFTIAMVMFGSIIYIPVYAQGVLGVNATNSGLILMPMMVGLVVFGMLAGLLVTRLGRYKEFMLGGVAIMAVGIWMLTRLGVKSSQTAMTYAMIVVGIGLGLAMQLYTLVVQNAATRKDLGIATAATQFFRNVGSTVGIAVFGTVMTAGLGAAIARHLPPGVQLPEGQLGAGTILDPSALVGLPPEAIEAVREGLAERLHDVFLLGLPLLALTFVATLAIRAIPLRDGTHSTDDAGRELLDSLNQTAHRPDELVPGLGHEDVGARTRERLLGLHLMLIAEQAQRDDRPLLRRAVAELGGGDLERGTVLLRKTSKLFTSDDPGVAARAEKFAAAVAERGKEKGGLLSPELRQELAVLAADADRRILTEVEPTVAERNEAVDIGALRAAANDLSAALLVDVAAARRVPGAEEPAPAR